MKLQDFFQPSNEVSHEAWMLGNLLVSDVGDANIVVLWLSDNRGANGTSDIKCFDKVKEAFYQLSKQDFQLPIYDLGSLISGKNLADTLYILEEILLTCHREKVLPVVIGGSHCLAYSLYSALNAYQSEVNYTQISNIIPLLGREESVNDKNFLSKIFENRDFNLKNFHLIGYQRHLNDLQAINLVKELGFDVLPLSQIMNTPYRAEPFFRKADLVTLNCDAVESFSGDFSLNPQINGLNNREICSLMKDIGLGEKLKSVGIFNYNFETKNSLNHQLLAQMLWYLLEGINIRATHPKKSQFETYFVMVQGMSFAFHRDVFRNLWYFGNQEEEKHWVPCLEEDYHNAKRGFLNERFSR